MRARRLRLGAYGVCVRDGALLLARWVSPVDGRTHWTLPGGGVEHGEDPLDTVVREVAEETGYAVAVDALLGVDSRRGTASSDGADLHHVGVFYRVTVTGGRLRDEVGGSTDRAAWTPLGAVPGLERAALVDVGLALDRERPADGHVPPVPPTDLLH